MRKYFRQKGKIGFASVYLNVNKDGSLDYVSTGMGWFSELWLTLNIGCSWLVTPGALFVWDVSELIIPFVLDLGEDSDA